MRGALLLPGSGIHGFAEDDAARRISANLPSLPHSRCLESRRLRHRGD